MKSAVWVAAYLPQLCRLILGDGPEEFEADPEVEDDEDLTGVVADLKVSTFRFLAHPRL